MCYAYIHIPCYSYHIIDCKNQWKDGIQALDRKIIRHSVKQQLEVTKLR